MQNLLGGNRQPNLKSGSTGFAAFDVQPATQTGNDPIDRRQVHTQYRGIQIQGFEKVSQNFRVERRPGIGNGYHAVGSGGRFTGVQGAGQLQNALASVNADAT